jgi:mannose-1-phosphate guanylyltransferase
VDEQLASANSALRAVLLEPIARNPAPAVVAAALEVAETDFTGPMLIAAADHAISNAFGFGAVVMVAAYVAALGRIVMFGVSSTRPEMCCGYLRIAKAAMSPPTRCSRLRA